jgi:hypothetical protein
MSFAETLAAVPARFSVVNLSTNDELVAQFNPSDFDDDLTNEFNRLSPHGASHQRMHFSHTNNYTVPLELYFTAATEAQYDLINKARHKIQSWCYPLRATETVPSSGPPRLLATWPLVFSIECYLTRCKIKYLRFAPDGRCTRFTASVTFEQCRDKPISSEEIAAAVIVRGESADAEVDRVVDFEGRFGELSKPHVWRSG